MDKHKKVSTLVITMALLSVVIGITTILLVNKAKVQVKDIPGSQTIPVERIVPMPWKIKYGKAELTVERSCIISGKRYQGSATETELSEFIKNFVGITPLTLTEKDNIRKYNTVFLLGNPQTNEKSLKYFKILNLKVNWDELGPQGYLLCAKRAKGKNIIICAGYDEAGTFYAFQSLKQLMKKRGDKAFLKEVIIFDKPRFKIRGFKGWGEGWDTSEYQRMAEFMAKYKLNFLMNCYLSFPQTCWEWRRPFSERQMQELKKLIDYCANHFIRFCFDINPCYRAKKELHFSDEKEIDLLLEKYGTLAALGAKWFALCLDDIGDSLYYPDDQERFKTFANAHVYLMKRLYKYLRDKNPDAELILCPTLYKGLFEDGNSYLETLGRNLAKDINFFWTGKVSCSRIITGEEADCIAGVIERRPFIWDNYPVTDWSPLAKDLGPVRDRSKFLYEHVAGWMSNSMIHPELSKFALITVADYTWNPIDYGYEEASNIAVLKLGGEEAYRPLKSFVEEYTGVPGDWGGNIGRLEEYIDRPSEKTLYDKCIRIAAKFRKIIPELKEQLDNKLLLDKIITPGEDFLQLADLYTLDYEMLEEKKEIEQVFDRTSDLNTYKNGLKEVLKKGEDFMEIGKKIEDKHAASKEFFKTIRDSVENRLKEIKRNLRTNPK